MAITGLVASRATPGILVKARAARPPVPLRRLPQAVLRSVLAPRRSGRFLHRPRAAVGPGCGQLLDLGRGRAPWRFPGAWTNSGQFAGAWKTARWFSTRSTALTERTGPFRSMPRSIGTPIWTGASSGSGKGSGCSRAAAAGGEGRGGVFAHRPVLIWDADLDWRKLRVGYLKKDFE